MRVIAIGTLATALLGSQPGDDAVPIEARRGAQALTRKASRKEEK